MDQLSQRVLDIVVGVMGLLVCLIFGPVVLAYKLRWGRWPMQRITCVGHERRLVRQSMPLGKEKRKILSPGRSFDIWLFQGTKATATPFAEHGLKLACQNLPLSWNLVKGEISIFGPQLTQLKTYLYLKSLLPRETLVPPMKPGLMGLAQLDDDRENCLGAYRRRIHLDKVYSQKSSLALNLKILLFSLFDLLPGART